MKILFFNNHQELNSPEENSPIKKLMANHFSKLELVEVDETVNLKELIIIDGPFSFIIIDIDNKKIRLSEIYETIHSTIGLRPFLFIGNLTSIKSKITDEILQQPLVNFIIETPLIQEEFNKAVNEAIDWVKKEEFEDSILELNSEELQKIRLRNFYLFDQLPYDVYVELTPNKYGKIIPKNKPYSFQIIQNYSRRNVKFFHLKKDDHLRFLSTSLKNLFKIYHAKLSDRKKYAFIHLKTIFLIHQYIKILSVTDEVIQLTHLFIDSVRDFLKYQPSLSELLDQVTEGQNMTFAEQGLATAYICESIIHHMGWTADMARKKLLLASILQDIGLENDELIKIRSLNDPQLKVYSEKDQLIFKNHPKKAAQISTFFIGFSDVDFILSEQHESANGTGFPNGLNSSGITTISCIFIIANNFVSRMASTKRTPTFYKEIFDSMKRSFHLGNFKDPLRALEKAFLDNDETKV